MAFNVSKGGMLCLLAVVLFSGCAKELSCEGCVPGFGGANKPPIANAGNDQTIILGVAELYLNATASSDPDNNISSYKWRQLTGTAPATLADSTAIKTLVTDLELGTYSFQLKVTDAFGLFSMDTVTILVAEPGEPIGRWKNNSPLPEIDFMLGSNLNNFLLGIQDKVFAISKNGTFWLYDVRENKWLSRGVLPSYAQSANLSVVFSIGNIGYIIGNGTCRQYNATNGQWITKSNAPVGASHVDYSVPLIIGNKAYLVGSTNNAVTLYDPAADTYTPLKKFVDVDAAAGFVLNGEGYCVQKDGRCWKYNVASDTWEQKASLPAGIQNISGFSLNGYGYILGSVNNTTNPPVGLLKLWRYDVVRDNWKQTSTGYPGQAAYALKTVSLNGIVYVGLGLTNGYKDVIDFWSFR